MVVIGISPASPTTLVCLKPKRFLKYSNHPLDALTSPKFESFSSVLILRASCQSIAPSGEIPAWQHLMYYSYNTLFMMSYFAIFFLFISPSNFSYSLRILFSFFIIFSVCDFDEFYLESSANGWQPSLGFCLCKSRSFTLSVRESVTFSPQLTRECTGVMVVNSVRMSFSSLSFVLFQMTNQNFGWIESNVNVRWRYYIAFANQMGICQTFTRSDKVDR